jgi:hypothetical protein
MKRISSLTLTLLVCLAPAGAIAQVMTPALDAAAASRLAAFAAAEARTRNSGGSIAVVDSGGHLLFLERLDNTFPAAAAVSIERRGRRPRSGCRRGVSKKPSRTVVRLFSGST